MKNKFIQSAEDRCLFRCNGTNGYQFFVLFRVDDILYFSNNNKMLHDFNSKLSDAFSIDDRGKMTWFLRCNVEQSHGRISHSQRSYIKDILRKSLMSDCKPIVNPGKAHKFAMKHFLRFLKQPSLYLLCITALKISNFLVFRIPIGHQQGRSQVNFGFCFKLSRSGSVVSWASKKQGCVALSSCEAEYVSLALAAQEAAVCKA